MITGFSCQLSVVPVLMLDCNGLTAGRIEVVESSWADDTACIVWSRHKVGIEREK